MEQHQQRDTRASSLRPIRLRARTCLHYEGPILLHAPCSLGMLGGMCVHTDALSLSELMTTRARSAVGSGSLSNGPSLQDTSSQHYPFLCSPCSTCWCSTAASGRARVVIPKDGVVSNVQRMEMEADALRRFANHSSPPGLRWVSPPFILFWFIFSFSFS